MSQATERGERLSGERRDDLPGMNRGSPLSNVKRPLSITLGGALVVRGLRRRSLRGIVTALAGGWLLYRGIKNRPIFNPGAITAALGRDGGHGERGLATVERSVTVDGSAEDLHEYWRTPEHLSKIMGSFAQITPSGDETLHWRIEGPMGKSLSWETRFGEDTPGEILRWKTVEGVQVPSEWTVRFRDAPGERGTEVTLGAEFEPPGGTIGAAAVNRFDFALASVVDTSLHRFKSLAETGEVPTLESNPSARGLGDLA